MPEKLLIVGGVAAGMTAATWARRQSPNLAITVLEQGAEVSYAECGMPYVWSGQIAALDNLVLHNAESLHHKYNIEVITDTLVENLNSASQSLQVYHQRKSQRDKYYYDYLVIATGARPRPLTIPGQNLAGVFSVRHMSQARRLDAYLKANQPRRAVIVGAGYLGLEMAESLALRGLSVTVISSANQILRTLATNLQAKVVAELTRHKVALRLNETILALTGETQVKQVVTSQGVVDADLVIVAIGVLPNVELATSGGVRLGATGAIAVKDSQQTNIPNIYAAGDCCEAWHLVTKQPTYLPLGTTANKQGRVAGINIAGGRAQFNGIVGTAAVKVFDLEIATTGLAVSEAQSAGFWPKVAEATSSSRAGYYPGATMIDTQIVYDERTGQLLGAQMVGSEGVAKRIDTLATALYSRLKIDDLLQLDLSYAPPFASVWEAIAYTARKAK